MPRRILVRLFGGLIFCRIFRASEPLCAKILLYTLYRSSVWPFPYILFLFDIFSWKASTGDEAIICWRLNFEPQNRQKISSYQHYSVCTGWWPGYCHEINHKLPCSLFIRFDDLLGSWGHCHWSQSPPLWSSAARKPSAEAAFSIMSSNKVMICNAVV